MGLVVMSQEQTVKHLTSLLMLIQSPALADLLMRRLRLRSEESHWSLRSDKPLAPPATHQQ